MKKTEKNILIAFILNITFSIFELVGGIFTNSIAIISDAVHDCGDAISIGLSYFLEKKSLKKPDNSYTYGYVRYSILGAFITTTILFVGSIFVIYHAFMRLINPVPINYNGMLIFAIFGVVINFLAAYFTKDGDSLNQKSVNLHMLEDVLGWIVVLIGSIIIKFTELAIIDSIMSIGVAIFILIHSFKNFKAILDLFLEKIPQNISIEEVKKQLLKNKNIKDIHHIHIWSIDGVNNYATMHIVSDCNDICKLKGNIRQELMKYHIGHVTIEVEDNKENCESHDCQANEIKVHHH